MPPKSPSQPCILISPLSTLEPTRFRTREQPKEEEEEGEDDDDEVQELREDETQNGHAFSSTTWRRASRHAAVEGYATQSLIEETVITSLFRSFQIPLQHTAIPSLSRRLGARCPGRASRGLVLQRPQLHARSDEVAVDEIDGVFDLAHVREQLRVRTRKKVAVPASLAQPATYSVGTSCSADSGPRRCGKGCARSPATRRPANFPDPAPGRGRGAT
mmetsp:Transcript_40911/g.83711  ORF Transcript_40911/g.83711 Transcript_40911/m.83711 type:complete len:217 (-) Transcript_40911:895-1545(-)